MIVIDQTKLEQRLREETQKLVEVFNGDMPNRAAQLGYQAAANDVMRCALALVREMGR